MVIASLPWNCRREEHSRSLPNKRLDKLFGACFRQMLSNLKALNQIVLPTEVGPAKSALWKQTG